MSGGRENFKAHLKHLRSVMRADEYIEYRKSKGFLLICYENGWLNFLPIKQKKAAIKEYVSKSREFERAMNPTTKEEQENVERLMIEEGYCPTNYTSSISCASCGTVPAPKTWNNKTKCPWCETTKRLQDEIEDFEENGSKTMREMMKSAPRIICIEDDIPW